MPGYKSGDVLAFSGRVENRGPESARQIVVRLNADQAVAGQALLAPGEFLGFTANYTVTDRDIAAGSATVRFMLDVEAGAAPGAVKSFAFEMATGNITEAAHASDVA